MKTESVAFPGSLNCSGSRWNIPNGRLYLLPAVTMGAMASFPLACIKLPAIPREIDRALAPMNNR